MPMKRVRVVFRSREPDRVSATLPAPSAMLIRDDVQTVRDVVEAIRSRFPVLRACELSMELGSFAVLDTEDASIIRDDETIGIVASYQRRRDVKHTPPPPPPPPETADMSASDSSSSIAEPVSGGRTLASNAPSKEVSGLDAKSLRKIEKHRARRIKVRMNRKLGRREREGAAVGSFVVMTDDAVSPPTPAQNIDRGTDSVPKAFSRTAQVEGKRVLPRGHFRFTDTPDVVEKVSADVAVEVPSNIRVDRAKRASNFSFRMIEEGDVDEAADEQPEEQPEPPCEQTDEGAIAEVAVPEETADQTLLMTTMAIRGANFFAPRTLSYYGLSNEGQAPAGGETPTEVQTRYETLPVISDLRDLGRDCVIAFKELEIVAWSPQLSAFKTATVVESCHESKTLDVVTRGGERRRVEYNSMHDVRLVSGDLQSSRSIDHDLIAALQARRAEVMAHTIGPQQPGGVAGA
ncbi:Uncharacterized protein PBTT_04815 [Plasmodiophora brassicae]